MTPEPRLHVVRAAELFHALSDPIRVNVVALLINGERCVCELMSELDLAITGRRVGRWNYYTLNAPAFAEARAILDALKPTRRLTVRAS